METISAVVVTGLMLAFTIRYIYQIIKHSTDPVLSTWLTFTTGVLISFVSYVIDSDFDLLSGILNTVDLLVVLSISITVALTRERTLVFKPFEKKYLLGAGAIVVYGLAFSDAWKSNLFSQALITIGWGPTLINMFKEGRNTESFSAWTLVFLASAIAMIPPIVNGNLLGILYSARSTACATTCLVAMSYLHLRQASSHPT
jgi:hypothetical protein